MQKPVTPETSDDEGDVLTEMPTHDADAGSVEVLAEVDTRTAWNMTVADFMAAGNAGADQEESGSHWNRVEQARAEPTPWFAWGMAWSNTPVDIAPSAPAGGGVTHEAPSVRAGGDTHDALDFWRSFGTFGSFWSSVSAATQDTGLPASSAAAPVASQMAPNWEEHVSAMTEAGARGAGLTQGNWLPQNAWSTIDDEVRQLTEIAQKLDTHYGRLIDIDWARDGGDTRIYILQARREAVAAQKGIQDLGELPPMGLDIMMKDAGPETVFPFAQLPNEGIGLACLESIIDSAVGVHPKALLNFGELDAETKALVDARMRGYGSPTEFYMRKLAEGVSTLAASVYPERIIVRLSDFKSSKHKSLIGGVKYEPDDKNPMTGFRGFGRCTDPFLEECFALELEAIKQVREEMGMTNVEIMISFVSTPEMARDVNAMLEKSGLKRGGLKVLMMSEPPINAFLAAQFLEYFDGFCIGSNDLTQFSIGLDRDSGLVAQPCDERNPAVKGGASPSKSERGGR